MTATEKKIIVLDDERLFLDRIGAFIREAGYVPLLFESPDELRRYLEKNLNYTTIYAFVLDIHIKRGQSGLELLGYLQGRVPDVPVIMVSDKSDKLTVLKAMETGAFLFIDKADIPTDLVPALSIATRQVEYHKQIELLKMDQVTRTGAASEFIGTGAVTARLKDKLKRYSETAGSKEPKEILITGETGTGKDLAARFLHELSARAGKPFVPLNLTTIPRELFEAELFGVKEYSVSGVGRRPGIFRAAEGGTVFLDEIGDLSFDNQAKLLRVLQEKKVKPIGHEQEIPVDVWIIAGTNKDLGALCREGKFRQDLYNRLDQLCVEIPPLRERKEDIPDLVRHFFNRESAGYIKISENAFEMLKKHDYRFGNIRELKALIIKLIYSDDSPNIDGKTVAGLLNARTSRSTVPSVIFPEVNGPAGNGNGNGLAENDSAVAGLVESSTGQEAIDWLLKVRMVAGAPEVEINSESMDCIKLNLPELMEKIESRLVYEVYSECSAKLGKQRGGISQTARILELERHTCRNKVKAALKALKIEEQLEDDNA